MNIRHFPSFFRRIAFVLQDAMFPLSCGGCGIYGVPLCDSCFQSIQRRSSQYCGVCGARETPLGKICYECLITAPNHDGIFAACHYGDSKMSRLIHLFKYRFLEELGAPLGTLLAESVLRSEIPLPDAIIPIPLHPRRERWRGWNQSVFLAEALLKHIPEDIAPPLLKDTIIRIRHTAPQMSFRDKKSREKNIKDAFQKNPDKKIKNIPFDIRGKRIWLVDDVAASGSTINSCASVLKQHGAKEVFGIVLAR